MNFDEQISQPCRHFINGAFVDSVAKKTFPTLNPAKDAKITDVALGEKKDIDLAVSSAKAASEDSKWAETSVTDRAKFLTRIADLIEKKEGFLARLESTDTGKPISETRTGDIARAAHNFRFFAELCQKQNESTFVSEDGSKHTARRESIGVCALITPWNLPLYLTTWKLAPALAQGNSVVIKPAELTPLSAHALAEIIAESELPKGVVNIVQGFGENGAGQALVCHPDVKAISFTGETSTGRAIMKDAAAGPKKLSFELGGKGASVIFADADLEKACVTSVRAAFRNQGQICLAGSRLLVEEKAFDQVVNRVREEISKIIIGDPLDEKTTMGSLISKEHRDKVDSYVKLAKDIPGVEVVCGGRVPSAFSKGAYYEPTLILGPNQDSRLIQEEIFGPVLTVQTFRDKEEALAMLNGTNYGLSCSIWSGSTPTQEFMAKRARFGLVWINSWFLRNLNTPFGGMKMSGLGREGGQHSLDFFSEWKTVTYL